MLPFARSLVVVCLAATFCLSAVSRAGAGHDYEEPVDFISSDQVKQLLELGEKVVFVDLRTAAAYEAAHLPDARSLPINELQHRWSEVPKAGRVVLYCDCPPGQRDQTFAFLLLWQEHYRNVSFLDIGFLEWVKRGYPVAAKAP